MRYRLVRYGLFTVGLFGAALSFLVCWGNALALEGRSESLEQVGILGTIAGSALAGLGIILGAVLSRRILPFIVVLLAGLAGATGGWSLGLLLFPRLNWLLAVALAPLGMWLGWLGGASRSRVAGEATIGGTVGAVLAALAFPMRGHR